MLNGLAAAFIAAYIAAVAYNDNIPELSATAKEETGFVKWILALFALAMIHALAGGRAKKIIEQVSVSALAALLISRGSGAMKQIDKFFK